ncbi:hypothetical protein CLOM_g15566 [Closterium sp. NIES-68]|nr:hypothetical protein CLOM_g3407 [Closterium sp. NIES-68]GJP56501.1 hypothetical protein CLOM_g15566 [Closterium sp. NIES-68]GJP79534.1 hypothetical protein CLOP_g9759 [Closterium sp. NIES-67]
MSTVSVHPPLNSGTYTLSTDSLVAGTLSVAAVLLPIQFDRMFCLVVLAALLLLSLAFLRRSSSRQNELSLEWETGRRKARQPFKKPPEFYEYYGVMSSEDYFVNSRGVELFTKQWLPIDGRLRGVVFYCHGYGDTCVYAFEDVALRLAASGYAVQSMDYEGFGMSAGLHGFIPRFDNLVDDVTEFAASLRARPALAHLPFFLYGESMGGAVALLTHLRQPSAWQGAILAAPMCKIAPEMMPPKPVVTTLSFLASIFPRAKLVPTREIAEIGFRDPVKRARLCENPVGYGGKPRLQTALQMLTATQRIGRDLDKVSLPFLLMHGAADVVTDPSVSEALFQQACSGDKTFRLYEGCWHGLTTAEPDDVTARILDDMVTWLHARSLPPSLLPSLRLNAYAAAAAAAAGWSSGLASLSGSTSHTPSNAVPLGMGGRAAAAAAAAAGMGGDLWSKDKHLPWHLLPFDADDESSSTITS